jgi:hypothetical protein
MALLRFGRTNRLREIAAANVTADTEVLRKGEAGYISETGEIRVGDGTNTFLNLKGGSRVRGVRTATATGNVTRSDDVVIVNSGSATTQTLPSAVLNSGRAFTIKNRGAGTVTVAAVAGTVETTSLATNASARYVSDGANWYAI